MNFKKTIHVLVLSLFAFAARGEEEHTFVFELRVPKGATNDPSMSVELATEEGSSATDLVDTKQREEEGFRVFQHSFLLFENKRRALIVGPQPCQVFQLSIPEHPKPKDWTEWRRPDYLAKGDAGWDFIYNQNKQSRSTNLPANCFQVRYKIEQTKSP